MITNMLSKQDMKTVQKDLVGALGTLNKLDSETAAWLFAFNISANAGIGEGKNKEQWRAHAIRCLDIFLKSSPFDR